MNPIKHELIKEIDRINKRNGLKIKESEIPQIKDEISILLQQHEKALEDCEI